MSLARQMFALMASRQPVVLRDGRVGFITRVDTSYPEEETTVQVWTHAGPGLARVSASEVAAAPEKRSA